MNKACVLIIEGTNCEEEMKTALNKVGIEAEIVHLKQLTGDVPKERCRKLSDYEILMLPGGWSAGDYVRAGAIFAARIKSKLMPELKEFVDNGYLVGGICNGFQILTELALLPAFKGIPDQPDAVLTNNANTKFQCRPTYLRHENKCAFTGKIGRGQVLQIPVAHGEGRLTFGEKDKEMLQQLTDNKQIVFRYCRSDGKSAAGEFPWNPNGSLSDIAGICNPEGNVLGMMPHPERVMEKIQNADWTRTGASGPGDGKILFESIAEYARKKG
ncbi:MAG: phosphoribosylformylglycinamidine synthase subunit PurQ [Candidatus Altiarchaeia archaeon]